MQIIYLNGKRSTHAFMPFGRVALPETYEDFRNITTNRKTLRWLLQCRYENTIRFCRRMNTLKSVLRRIEKQNYPAGTAVLVRNWYVGYSDIIVIV